MAVNVLPIAPNFPRQIAAAAQPPPKPQPPTIDWSQPADAAPSYHYPALNQGKRYRLSTEAFVQKGQYAFSYDPPCSNNPDDAVENARNIIAAPAVFAGAMLGSLSWGSLVGSALASTVQDNKGGVLLQAMRPNSHSNCQQFGLYIPVEATLLAVTYWASPIDSYAWLEVQPEHDLEWAKWERYRTTAVTRSTDHKQFTLVWSNFKNWSADHPRQAGLIVAFDMP